VRKLIALGLAGMVLVGCGSGGGSEASSERTTTTRPTPTTDPVAAADAPTPAEANEAIKQAFSSAGLKVCQTDDEDGYVDYGLDSCPTDSLSDAAGWVGVHTYRTPEDQQADLPMRESDMGVKGWSWELSTIILVDGYEGPTDEVKSKLDKAMDDLGADVAFDNTDYAG